MVTNIKYFYLHKSKWLDVSHTLRSKLWERNQLAGLELLDADEIVLAMANEAASKGFTTKNKRNLRRI